MTDIFFFGKFRWHGFKYEIYPYDETGIFEQLYREAQHDGKAQYDELILIQRKDNLLYHAYVWRMDDGQRLGIGYISDTICRNFNTLLDCFRSIPIHLLSEQPPLIVSYTLDGTIIQLKEQLQKRATAIDIFVQDNRDNLLSAFGSTQKLQGRNMEVSVEARVEGYLRHRGSKWFIDKIERGYHRVCIYIEQPTKPANRNNMGVKFISHWRNMRKCISNYKRWIFFWLFWGGLLAFCLLFLKWCSTYYSVENSDNDQIHVADSTIHVAVDTAELTPISPASTQTDAQKVNSLKTMKDNFVLVPAGTLKNVEEWVDDGTKICYDVPIDSFYICKYELTQGEYEQVMETLVEENYTWESYADYGSGGKVIKKGDSIPVISSYRNFVEYCNKKSKSEGYDGFYEIDGNAIRIKQNGNGYRLPNHFEWEFAAKGGNSNDKYPYSGSSTLAEVGWYGRNSGNKPHPVGQKKPNRLGIYDMSGNVSEMLQDDPKWKWRCIGGSDFWDWPYCDTEIGGYEESSWTGCRIVFIPSNMTNRNTNLSYKVER